MRCEFQTPGSNAPEAILANVDVVFDDPSDPLCGLKLTGIVIRKGKDGEWVSLPARKDAKGAYHDYVRSAAQGMKPVYAFKNWIIEQWNAHLQGEGVAAPTRDADEDSETPF